MYNFTIPMALMDFVPVVFFGVSAALLLRDLRTARENHNARVCCFIDDNPNKWDRYVDGVPVVGGRDTILLNATKYHIDKIYVAIPGATMEQKRDILNICKETGCDLKNLPGVTQLVNGEVTVNAMRDVAVEDLLGRDTIQVDMGEIFEQLSGKTQASAGAIFTDEEHRTDDLMAPQESSYSNPDWNRRDDLFPPEKKTAKARTASGRRRRR